MRPTTASTVRYSRSGHRKDGAMINGAHAILYSDDAAATRATLAKVLGTRTVDAGGGWHQHRVRIAEVLKEVVPDVVADCVGIPDRTGEQVLHAIRGGVPGVLGQGPAVGA
jgi:threonine dehydrogenase-like Zn-dependent dehydrogenase